jgi:hypothetical protein
MTNATYLLLLHIDILWVDMSFLRRSIATSRVLHTNQHPREVGVALDTITRSSQPAPSIDYARQRIDTNPTHKIKERTTRTAVNAGNQLIVHSDNRRRFWGSTYRLCCVGFTVVCPFLRGKGKKDGMRCRQPLINYWHGMAFRDNACVGNRD